MIERLRQSARGEIVIGLARLLGDRRQIVVAESADGLIDFRVIDLGLLQRLLTGFALQQMTHVGFVRIARLGRLRRIRLQFIERNHVIAVILVLGRDARRRSRKAKR